MVAGSFVVSVARTGKYNLPGHEKVVYIVMGDDDEWW